MTIYDRILQDFAQSLEALQAHTLKTTATGIHFFDEDDHVVRSVGLESHLPLASGPGYLASCYLATLADRGITVTSLTRQGHLTLA